MGATQGGWQKKQRADWDPDDSSFLSCTSASPICDKKSKGKNGAKKNGNGEDQKKAQSLSNALAAVIDDDDDFDVVLKPGEFEV